MWKSEEDVARGDAQKMETLRLNYIEPGTKEGRQHKGPGDSLSWVKLPVAAGRMRYMHCPDPRKAV